MCNQTLSLSTLLSLPLDGYEQWKLSEDNMHLLSLVSIPAYFINHLADISWHALLRSCHSEEKERLFWPKLLCQYEETKRWSPVYSHDYAQDYWWCIRSVSYQSSPSLKKFLILSSNFLSWCDVIQWKQDRRCFWNFEESGEWVQEV
jgi:hypothetical protein